MEVNKQTLENELLRLHDNMLSFAYKLTTNIDDAKDLTQETMLKAISNFDKYYDNVNFKGWVFTIMHNTFINNYRRMVRSYTIVDQTDNLYYINQPQGQKYESDNSESMYSVQEIYNVIDTFSEGYRKPFLMHLKGYKYEEIADDMQLPLGTIKSRIFFTRKRLQEKLKDYI